MFQPLGDRVLVKRLKQEEKTQSGLILPNQKKEDKYQVVKLGEGRRDIQGNIHPYNFEIGDVVWIERFQVIEIDLDETYFVVRGDNITGILKEKESKIEHLMC